MPDHALLEWLAPATGRSLLGALLDSLALSAVLLPAVWLLVVRPLRALDAERGALLARVFEGQEAERLCEDLEIASGIRVDRSIGVGAERLPLAVELTVYRVLQEALSNAARHSGATEIRVSIAREGRALRLAIMDNGPGFSGTSMERGADATSGRTSGGLGLVGMRERVALLGGRLEVGTGAQGGASIVARIPCPEATE